MFIRQFQHKTEKLLNTYGIKFISGEKRLDKVPVDGFSFWSGSNPTIVSTQRMNRIDNFAFTIMHELGHIFNYLRSFFHGDFPVVNHPAIMADIPVTPPESDAIAKDMKKRGFKFFGSTICYAHLQATGFVDDHIDSCHCKGQL